MMQHLITYTSVWSMQIRRITKPDHWHWHLSIAVCIYTDLASQCIALNQSAKQESSQNRFFKKKIHNAHLITERMARNKMYSCICQHFKFFFLNVNVRLLASHLKLCDWQNLHDNTMACSNRSVASAHCFQYWQSDTTILPISQAV